MRRKLSLLSGLFVLLVVCVFITGCTTSSDQVNQTSQPSVTTTPAAGSARYTAGDIVRNPASTATTALLIIRYDAASDTYERALIYPNADGSWGYRSDTRTEKTGRSVIDKVYTEILGNKNPSSVPIGTPTIITPEETTRVTVSATAVTLAAPKPPSITSIIPDTGYAGTSVSVKNLAGENFVAGATAALSRNGSSIIRATDVRFVSNKSIICTFVIPSDAVAGAWDVTVTNPDGQSDTVTNFFEVHRDPSVLTTSSTLSAGTVPITSIDPSFAYAHDYKEFVIIGSKFQTGATVKLLRDGKTDIEASTVRVMTDTEIRCFFDIPYTSTGTWDLLVTNPDQTYGRRFGIFEVKE
ncbi:MAG: hypothetical protein WCB46_06500 [Methanoregula sp.]